MFDFESMYDRSTNSYLIPEEYITKGIKKNIEQVVDNIRSKHQREVCYLAETHDGSLKYISQNWGKDRSKKVPIDDVIEHSLSVAKYKQWTANNCRFVENIHKQGWISLKQYMVIREIVLRQSANASWESDEDTELSPSYYGLQWT